MIGGHHVPRRVSGAATSQHVPKGHLVGLPLSALDEVLGIKLPLLAWFADPIFESATLLRLADVQENLYHAGVALDQHALKFVYLPVARLPDRPRHQSIDARNQHVFVMRAVEYRDLAAGRRVRVDAPQIIVRQFLGARCLEGVHGAALRIKRREHVADGAVLAAAVDCLQDHQHTVAAVRVQSILQIAELSGQPCRLGARLRFLPAVGVRRSRLLQFDAGGAAHPQFRRKVDAQFLHCQRSVPQSARTAPVPVAVMAQLRRHAVLW